MGQQSLKDGQPIYVARCPHGIEADDRDNTACEECFNRARGDAYQEGLFEGIRLAAAFFRERAGRAFAIGDDEEARRLRDYAKRLNDLEMQKREEHERSVKERGS